MTEETSKKLEDLSYEEVQNNPEIDFSDWKKAKEQKLEEQGQKNRQKINQKQSRAVNKLIDASESELVKTIEFGDVEILVEPKLDREQQKYFQELTKGQKNLEETTLEDIKSMKDELIGFLNSVTKSIDGDEINKKDWEVLYEELGLVFLIKILKEVISCIKEDEEEIRNFR